jgi:hypothetical protein
VCSGIYTTDMYHGWEENDDKDDSDMKV